MNYFTFDERSSTEWGIGLSGTGVWDAPARKGEQIYIPGRNGAVWVDDGSFENIEVAYPCWMSEGFSDRIDDFRAFLEAHADQYYQLTDTYHPNEYRRGRYAGEFEAEPGTRNLSGRFNVVFDCEPFRYNILDTTTLDTRSSENNVVEIKGVTENGYATIEFEAEGDVPDFYVGIIIAETEEQAYNRQGTIVSLLQIQRSGDVPPDIDRVFGSYDGETCMMSCNVPGYSVSQPVLIRLEPQTPPNKLWLYTYQQISYGSIVYKLTSQQGIRL